MKFSVFTDLYGWHDQAFDTLTSAKIFVQNSLNEGRKVIWKANGEVISCYRLKETSPFAEIHREK